MANIRVDWWLGVLAPAGTPDAIIQKLSAEIMTLSQNPDFRANLLGKGIEVVGSAPEPFAALLQEEVPRWRTVVKSANITVE